MHLKSHPKLIRSELHIDATSVHQSSQRSSLFVSQQGGLLRTFTGNHGNISSSHVPLSIISTNRLCCTNTTSSNISSVTSLLVKIPSRAPPQPPGSENSPEMCQTRTKDADADPNMWTVIKPGHVKEKIAIFASEERWTEGVGVQFDDTNSPPKTGMSRAVKAKWSWEEDSNAKRCRKSDTNQKLQQDKSTLLLVEAAPCQSDGSLCGGRAGEGGEQEQKLSVMEMVAFLEQRAGEQQPDLKPLLDLQRSSAMFGKLAPPATREESENVRVSEMVARLESENVRVSEMVARLESECLRRKMEEGVSRTNSLRRTVGRLLLTTGASSGGVRGCEEAALNIAPHPGELTEGGDYVTQVQPVAPPSPPAKAEPLPGLLFLSAPPAEMTPPQTRSGFTAHNSRSSFYVELAPPNTVQPRPAAPGSDSQSERWDEEAVCATRCPAATSLTRSASVSQDFLDRRQQLQRLLAPQPFLLTLPHHLLVQILLLLPTQSLAVLKCSCTYFKFIIENYAVRPADSLWVSDHRYRDDPCKQCKKRYAPGDVSLCRWHHKPYCQALPYGPGYWMCCHGAHRDTPGCNVGLHDNRWVPSFHCMNVPISRRNCTHDN